MDLRPVAEIMVLHILLCFQTCKIEDVLNTPPKFQKALKARQRVAESDLQQEGPEWLLHELIR